MKIRAIVPFSTGTITMEQYEIKEVPDEAGARLVAAGLVTEIGGGSGGGVVVVHETVSGTIHTLDKTWQEIHDAFLLGHVVIATDDRVMAVTAAVEGLISIVASAADVYEYVAESENGYPSYDEGSSL